MAVDWRVELNPDVSVSTDGTHCRIGGVVSVTVALAEVEFVWLETPGIAIEQHGRLDLRLKDRPGTLASIRMSRREAEQVRTMLETAAPSVH